MLLADLILMAVGIAVKYDLDPDMVTRLIQAESGWDQWAVSSTGCVGLCQISLTAWPLKDWVVSTDDPFNVRANLEQGAYILKFCIDRYVKEQGESKSLAVAAYTLGHGEVDELIIADPKHWDDNLPEPVQDYVYFVVAAGHKSERWGNWNWRDAIKGENDDTGIDGIFRRDSRMDKPGRGRADHIYRADGDRLLVRAEPVLTGDLAMPYVQHRCVRVPFRKGSDMRLTNDEIKLLKLAESTCGRCDIVELDAKDQVALVKLMYEVRDISHLLEPRPEPKPTAAMIVKAIWEMSKSAHGMAKLDDPEVLQNYISLVREDLDLLRKIVKEKING